MSPRHIALVGLGGNLGEAAATLREAFKALDHLPQTRLMRASRLYRTPAWGRTDQPDFINAVAMIETALAPRELLGGLRRGLYLFLRWRRHGRHRRYEGMRKQAEKQGLNFAMYSLLWVFAPQLLLQFVVALPATLGQIAPTTQLGALGWAGAALSLFGILYEAIADAQLTRFKRDPANAGKVMDRGLWRYSRHPNYFGDMCAWWGMYLVAAETGLGLWSLPGPLLLTFLLTRVSGAPTTEPHLKRTRPDYEAYKARTSAFIPLPPKRASNSKRLSVRRAWVIECWSTKL